MNDHSTPSSAPSISDGDSPAGIVGTEGRGPRRAALPKCTTKNTILDAPLIARYASGELIKLVVVVFANAKVSYLTAHFTDEPVRPIFLATRRNRKEPKLFVDQNRLLQNLRRDFPGSLVEVQAYLLESAVPPSSKLPAAGA